MGTGVFETLCRNHELLEARAQMRYAVKKVAVRDMSRVRDVVIAPDMLTNDWRELVNDEEIDIIIELIGGTTEAYELVTSALKAGKPVVTGNKALLAEYGSELFQLSAQQDYRLAWVETMQDNGIQTDGVFYTREELGTVSIAGGAGVNFRIGYNLPCAMQMTRNLSATYGSGTIRKPAYNPEEASYFVVAGASVDYIARDMFIDGGVFHDFERTCGRLPWQVEGRLGIGVRRKGVDYYAGAFVRSRGYRSQVDNTALGTFSMTFHW